MAVCQLCCTWTVGGQCKASAYHCSQFVQSLLFMCGLFQEWNAADPSPSSSATESETDSASDDSDGLVARRSKRQRKDISYKFEDYDKMIGAAIEDDLKNPISGEEKTCLVRKNSDVLGQKKTTYPFQRQVHTV